MRTVKRQTLLINAKKHAALKRLCAAYAREKRFWLDHLRAWENQARLYNSRDIRDEFVKNGYKSIAGLQARHWKLAFEDAVETWDKYWQALFVKGRSIISHNKNLSETERHYAFWLLKGYSQFAEMMQGNLPEPLFEINKLSMARVTRYTKKIIKNLRGKPPSVKKNKTAKFDANCYEVFEHNGRQYIKLMSQERGKRIVIPLSGYTQVKGNITLVLSDEFGHIHVAQELDKRDSPKEDLIEAVDFGYTEVMTDTQGIRYGKKFGSMLTDISNHLDTKMQKRHKLHSLKKKQMRKTRKKANRIRKYNLGSKKLSKKMHQARASCSREINTGINELLKTKNPSILVTEDLSHLFTYNKAKTVNRKLSMWVRGEIQKRISFKALAKGFRHEQVNPAYGSQTCPNCEFVEKENRKGDKFKCLNCRYEDVSDRVAAMNYARRYGDLEIGRYTPYPQVKIILLGRFHRRLETEKSVTVPGRTLETVELVDPPLFSRQTPQPEDNLFRTVNQRAKQNKHVSTRF